MMNIKCTSTIVSHVQKINYIQVLIISLMYNSPFFSRLLARQFYLCMDGIYNFPCFNQF